MSVEIAHSSHREDGRRYFSSIKIVTTKKDHLCEVCSKPIPKGTRALCNSGRSLETGFFNCYFHLDKVNRCYLEFAEVVWLDQEKLDIIKREAV